MFISVFFDAQQEELYRKTSKVVPITLLDERFLQIGSFFRRIRLIQVLGAPPQTVMAQLRQPVQTKTNKNQDEIFRDV